MAHLIYDEHVHLRPHQKPPPAHQLQPMIDAAREQGVILGVREHAPLPEKYQIGPNRDYFFAMSPDELDGFMDQFRGTDVAFGLEVDYFPDVFDETRQTVEAILDRARAMGLVIGGLHGSAHLLPGDIDDVHGKPTGLGVVMWDDTPEHFEQLIEARGLPAIIEDYHDWLIGLVRTGFFQTLSHIDLLRKFDRVDDRGQSRYFAGNENLYEEAMFDVLAAAAECEIAVELNTQGLDRPYGRPFLSQKALVYCRQKQIPVAFGSDAHRPEEVGRHFETAAQMFAEAGIERLVYFRELRPHYWTLV